MTIDPNGHFTKGKAKEKEEEKGRDLWGVNYTCLILMFKYVKYLFFRFFSQRKIKSIRYLLNKFARNFHATNEITLKRKFFFKI